MKIFHILAVVVMVFIAVPAQAETHIQLFNIGTPIEFNNSKPDWYKSAYFHIEKEDRLPFEVALETAAEEKGEWSMHFTNPKVPKSNKIDITSQLFYVGMRYKFE